MANERANHGIGMATVEDLTRLALALEGTREVTHQGLLAFAAEVPYVIVGRDGNVADFKFSPDEQEFKCFTSPDVFSPAPDAAGREGWTRAHLPNLSMIELQHALEVAWEHAVPRQIDGGKSLREPRRGSG